MRGAAHEEYPLVREILARAFKTEDEAFLWDFLVQHDPSLRPEMVRVAVLDGRPVACTVLLPRQVRTRQGWAPGAIVTLVGCLPELQGKGYGGATVREAVAYMQEHGMAVGVLFGHPDYYPRFGFAPVLPWYETLLTAEAAGRTVGPGGKAARGDAPSVEGCALVSVEPADYTALTALYGEAHATNPCGVARTGDPWAWTLRHPDRNQLLTLPDRQGYAFVGDGKDGVLPVHEAAATDLPAARRLLAALGAEATDRGLAKLKLALPSDHLLVQLARFLGASHTIHAAGPGMAVITDWSPVLPPGYRVSAEGLYGDGALVVRADRASLTQLALGYRSIDDLLLDEGVTVTGDAGRLRGDFPPLCPKWALEPFWY